MKQEEIDKIKVEIRTKIDGCQSDEDRKDMIRMLRRKYHPDNHLDDMETYDEIYKEIEIKKQETDKQNEGASKSFDSGAFRFIYKTIWGICTLIKIRIIDNRDDMLHTLTIPEFIEEFEEYDRNREKSERFDAALREIEVVEKIKKIIIPKSVRWITARSFEGLTGVEEVEFLADQIKIDEGAFYGCTKLSAVKLPVKTTVFPYEYKTSYPYITAFGGSLWLEKMQNEETEVDLEKSSNMMIGYQRKDGYLNSSWLYRPFDNCDKLTGGGWQYNQRFETTKMASEDDRKLKLSVGNCKEITKFQCISLHFNKIAGAEQLERIRYGAFWGCCFSEHASDIVLPNVVEIEPKAFEYTKGIKSITLYRDDVLIREGAFFGLENWKFTADVYGPAKLKKQKEIQKLGELFHEIDSDEVITCEVSKVEDTDQLTRRILEAEQNAGTSKWIRSIERCRVEKYDEGKWIERWKVTFYPEPRMATFIRNAIKAAGF